jgi:hypothetical protein
MVPAEAAQRHSFAATSGAKTGADAAGFAPPGWRVETHATGDLNGDRILDLAFILIAEDAANYLIESSPPPPRMLGVAFGRRDGRYALALLDRGFLPPKTPPNGLSQGFMLFQDGSLDASGGRLRVNFEYTRANTTFTLRWQSGTLRMIGYDGGGVEGGCLHHLSVNFLSHRAKLTAGWIDQDEQQVGWRKLPRRPLMTVAQIGNGGDFDPHGIWMNFSLSCPARS